MKQNCWEFKKCGREPGGDKVSMMGFCPVAYDRIHKGKNNGFNAGRYCWRTAGTFCGGVIQGTFASKMDNCEKCEFFKLVKDEEGKAFIE